MLLYYNVTILLCYYISILLCGSVNFDPGLESLRNVISVKNNAGQTGYELCRCSVARVMVRAPTVLISGLPSIIVHGDHVSEALEAWIEIDRAT